MSHRFLAALIGLAIITLLTYTVLFNPSASASQKGLTIVSHTKGYEVLKAEVVDNEVRIHLQNNHKSTITAFAISFNDTTIKEDFAFSDIHFGIEPGDTFEKNFPLSVSTTFEPPPLNLLAVVLKDGSDDGDSKVAREIKDERLGEKIQILRTLRIFERHSPTDLERMRPDIVAALNASESETLVSLNELSPTSQSQLSDHLKAGLQWGREKMLQRFDVLEKLPTELREHGSTELKARSQKLLSKL